MVNYTFKAVTPSEISKIKEAIIQNFEYEENKVDKGQKEEFNLDVYSEGCKMKVIGYESRTILIQGSSSQEFEENLKAEIRQFKVIEDEEPEISKTESQINKDLFLGFDESGKGECFGPLVLCGALIKKEEVENWEEQLDGIDAKDLSKKELNYWINEITASEGIKTFINKIRSIDIVHSGMNIDRMMDSGYLDILKDNRNRIPSFCVVVDDYGIRNSLKKELNSWEEKGAEIIVNHKADKNYVSSKIASIVARRERKNSVEYLIERNKIEYNGKTYALKDGAHNDKNLNWLKAYRSKYPSRRLPHFIRTNWSNIKTFEKDNPRNNIEVKAECNSCSCCNNLVYGVKRRRYIELFCPFCGNKLGNNVIDRAEYLIPDTNILIIRAISTDISSKNPYLKGKSVLLHKKVKQEIDNLPKSKRSGANKEIKKLNSFPDSDLKLVQTEMTFGASDFLKEGIRDEKIIEEAVKENNAAFMSADKTQITALSDCSRIQMIHPDAWDNKKQEYLLH